MNDSFGVPLEPGDYALSASTSGAQVKIGHIVQGKYQLMIEIDYLAVRGERMESHNKRSILGHNVVVLRKADGTVPAPLAAVYD